MFLARDSTPRWLIFSLDIGLALFSLILSFFLRFNFSIPQVEIDEFPFVFPIFTLVRGISFYVSRIFTGIIRYTSTKDAQRIVSVLFTGSVILCFLNLFRFFLLDGRFVIPFSVIIIEFLASTFIMISFRITVKVLYFELKSPSKSKSNVVIYGAGESGVITKRTLDRDKGTRFKVLAFIDDNDNFKGKKIEDISIYGFKELDNLLVENDVESVIISIQRLDPDVKKKIIDKCLQFNTRVQHVPPVQSWINGELSFNQIRSVKIEDLLGRQPIKLDSEKITNDIKDKTILITGAAGSIGSEITRQLIRFKPKKLYLLDQSESPLYEVEFEHQIHIISGLMEVVIADIRSLERMNNVMKSFKPDMVFHAAAYKHVPMMEENPSEAIRTNVLGTKILADLCIEHHVDKFIMISTDKAVNPTNVMGSSKRIAEVYTQALNKSGGTKFITTRFGNVLGSNGSVIPLFRKQIESGGPITVTHPEVTRYFMTIPEACQLVLQAAAIGGGGEIFIFDMGESVKIIDLAKKMIKLSGLELGKDIQIKISGLRPGEKLYEELLNDKENTLPTPHPQIMIAKVRDYEFERISHEINELILLYTSQDNNSMVKKLKSLIPEYISQNSVYSKLDVDQS